MTSEFDIKQRHTQKVLELRKSYTQQTNERSMKVKSNKCRMKVKIVTRQNGISKYSRRSEMKVNGNDCCSPTQQDLSGMNWVIVIKSSLARSVNFSDLPRNECAVFSARLTYFIACCRCFFTCTSVMCLLIVSTLNIFFLTEWIKIFVHAWWFDL